MNKSLLAIALLSSAVAFAQRAPVAKAPTLEDMLITNDQLQSYLANAPVDPKTGKPGSVSAQLYNGGTYAASFIRLDEPDTPHTHTNWAEVYVIREGSGTLVTGGTMVGPFNGNSAVHRGFFANGPQAAGATQTTPAEPPPITFPEGGVTAAIPRDASGTKIEGGKVQDVKPGDIILIPIGVPHTWTKVNGSVVYLDVKFPTPAPTPKEAPAPK